MSDNAEVSVAAATPKKTKAASKPKTKKPKTAPTHPKVSEMVNNAITTLKERGGSSLVAIKKFIASTYKVDVEKLSPFIKKYLKSSVVAGALVQTKGKGANGSFRMGGGVKEKSVAKPKKKSAASTPKKAKPAAAKKVAKPKKVTAKKPKKAVTPKKAKSTAAKKTPAKKPKAAKPKSAAKPKKSPVKKTPKKTPGKKAKK